MIQNEASNVAELLEPHSTLTRSSCHHVWVWTVLCIITDARNLWYRTKSRSVLFCTLYCMCQFRVWTDRYQLYSSQCEPHSRLLIEPYSETLQEYLFSSSDIHYSKLEKTHQCTLQIGPVAVLFSCDWQKFCRSPTLPTLTTHHSTKRLTRLAIVQRTWVYLLFSISRYHYYGLSIKETSMYYRSVYSKKGLTR